MFLNYLIRASHGTLVVKNLPVNAGNLGDVGSIPGSGRAWSRGTATHSSILTWRIPMDRGAWWATVHRVAESQTQLNQLSTHTFRIFHQIITPSDCDAS